MLRCHLLGQELLVGHFFRIQPSTRSDNTDGHRATPGEEAAPNIGFHAWDVEYTGVGSVESEVRIIVCGFSSVLTQALH